MKNICCEFCSNCNLNCDYCISSDNINLQEVPYNQVVNFIKMISPQRIVISGGEPLLDKNLIPKLTLLRKELPDSFISLSSNGSICYDFDKLKGIVDCIDISLPTLDKQIYESMRGKDKVEIVTENIEKIIASHFYTRVSCMLTKVNKDTVVDLLSYLQQIKVDEVRLGRFFPFRNASQLNDKYSLTDIEISEFIDKLSLSSYTMKIVPPIKSLKLMENGYLTMNYGGEIFYPSQDGKKIIGNIYNTDPTTLDNINDIQNKIFVGMSTKSKVLK